MSRRALALVAAPVVAALGLAVSAPAGAASTHHNRKAAAFRAEVRAHILEEPGDPEPPTIGTCSLIVPGTARIVQFDTAIPVRVTGGCALRPGPYAEWFLGTDADNATDVTYFENARTAVWDLYAFSLLGTHQWTGEGAYDTDFEHQYTQNAPTTTVKVGSWAGLQVTRSGSKVTLNTRVVRYATSLDENIPWVGETGIMQFRTPGTTTWQGLKNVTADSNGAYAYSYTSSAAR